MIYDHIKYYFMVVFIDVKKVPKKNKIVLEDQKMFQKMFYLLDKMQIIIKHLINI